MNRLTSIKWPFFMTISSSSLSLLDLLCLPEKKLFSVLEQKNFRAQGPGGQKVNKTESGVTLHYAPFNLKVSSQKYRSREENKKKAYRLFRQELGLRATTFAPEELRTELLPYFQNALKIQMKNDKLPLLFYVICGFFYEFEGEHKKVAQSCAVSSSCLLRFCSKHKRLWERINLIRKTFKKHPLKAK
jgi:hypothetical protein